MFAKHITYLPAGWQNMTPKAVNDYLANHSQEQIKADNEKLFGTSPPPLSPITNQPVTEEIYQMPVMNFDEVSQAGFGGGLMEGSASAPPSKPQSYAGAGGALPGQVAPQQNDETPYTMPSLFPEWDQRLQSVASKPTGNASPMFHENAFITEEVYQMPSVMSVEYGAVQNKGDRKSVPSVGREEDSVPYTMPSVF